MDLGGEVASSEECSLGKSNVLFQQRHKHRQIQTQSNVLLVMSFCHSIGIVKFKL